MKKSIETMKEKLYSILGEKVECIYLYGSVPMNDFMLGWSDIDLLCLTNEALSDAEAEQLVELRQSLQKEYPENLYYRSFEGAILSMDEFLKKQYTKVVYWGTSGQRITDNYAFDVFSMYELIKYGQLIYGNDIRNQLILPTNEELKAGVSEHYQAIRNYAVKTDERLYSCGWLLDIARCIYTLRYHDVISKTSAGDWAIQENLCPVKEQMLRALVIRRNPLQYKDQSEVKEWLCSLGPAVQLFADVLENELNG